ncbi:hypothetical protein M3Y99_01275600 [Aphelenchoides fujianensis]|nr:hypothetical protein M3Y99_01275600 [Aphelenchoides fujianensis]
MVGCLHADFSLLLVLSMFVGGAASADCVMKGRTENYVTIKTTDDCRSTSTTLVLARESLDFTIWVNGAVHKAKTSFKFGSGCNAKAEVEPEFIDNNPALTFNGKSPMSFDVKGALSTSALVFSPLANNKFEKEFSCSNAFSKRNATHFSLHVAIEWTGEAPNLDIKFENAAVFEYTTGELVTIAGLSIAGGEPSTITHSIGLTCHDDPPPRRPIGPPSKPNAAKKTVEGCGTKTADAFGLHVHDEAPPKSPRRPKSAGLTVQDKSEPTKTVWTGATVVTEEGSKPSKESAPSGPSGSK